MNKPHKIRLFVGIIIMLLIACMHGFRLGSYIDGDLNKLYYSFASDIVLPFGSYFLLVMNEVTIKFLRKWYTKAIIVFCVMTFSEIMQLFEIYFFGVTYDPFDILMYALGTLLAVILDKIIFERYLKEWKLQ